MKKRAGVYCDARSRLWGAIFGNGKKITGFFRKEHLLESLKQRGIEPVLLKNDNEPSPISASISWHYIPNLIGREAWRAERDGQVVAMLERSSAEEPWQATYQGIASEPIASLTEAVRKLFQIITSNS